MHLMEFCHLWSEVNQQQLRPNVFDSISWKFSEDGQYSARSAYQAQFIGSMSTDFERLIWRVWAPPKCKFFSWLAIQDRIWTANRLARRGWPHIPLCALCRSTQESGIHLFANCRFVKRIWREVALWTASENLLPSSWGHYDSVCLWWTDLADAMSRNKKGVRSLIILVIWEICRERNARIFDHREASVQQVLNVIKGAAALWSAAGAKHLGGLIRRE